jgi:DNA-binding MarR family transcriptional regulator
MNRLADEVALHQSTLTRVVEKLEDRKLVVRERPVDDQRVVNVRLTDDGKNQYSQIDAASNHMIARVFALVDPAERAGAVRGLEVLCDLLDPRNARAQQIITGDCRCDDPQAPAAGPLPEVER